MTDVRRSWLLAAAVTFASCASGGNYRTDRSGAARDECAGATQKDMDLRVELFAADVAKSVAFYTDVLGFKVERKDPDYVSLCRGGVVFGIGPITKVSGNHFFSPEVGQVRGGLGVEIVLAVDDVEAAEKRVRASGQVLVAPLKKQRWGLTDFRLADPDGYFIRVTSR